VTSPALDEGNEGMQGWLNHPAHRCSSDGKVVIDGGGKRASASRQQHPITGWQ